MSLYRRVAIVGVGLIGGSIGMALIRRKLADHVVGIGRDQKRLQAAQKLGAAHSVTTDLAVGIADAELVVVCTPVGRIVDDVLAVASACKQPTLITDAGSTKTIITRDVEQQLAKPNSGRDSARFLGGHPIAGNEKQGAAHSREDLFEGRVTVLTPTTRTLPTDREALTKLWEALGARVVEMTPEEHDQALAAISHVPHVVAAALAAATPAQDVPLVAGGWLDTTRVAAGDPGLWLQILLANRGPVLAALAQVEEKLTELRSAIEKADGAKLLQLLQEAKRIRDAVGN